MMMNLTRQYLCLSIIIAFIKGYVVASDEEFSNAKIFLHKSALSSFPLIVDQNVIIKYLVHNDGTTDASLLTITDRYDPNSFGFVSGVAEDGSVLMKIDALGSGEWVSS